MQNLVPKTFNYIKEGDQYGRLTVKATYVIRGTYRYMAMCDCSCGKTDILFRIDGLRSKSRIVTSCGCYHLEVIKKHGCWGHPLFTVWNGMMGRCYKSNDKRYRRYGGRGIQVCQHWHDPNNFIQDMYPTYEKGLQIDRINNDGNYEPSNCRWVPHSQNNRNKSTNILLTHNGETRCMKEWAEITGLNLATIWDRINIYKWDIDKALSHPPIPHTESLPRAVAARAKKRSKNQ